MRRRRTSKHRRGGVLPPGTYRKWAMLFRPELLAKLEPQTEALPPRRRQQVLFSMTPNTDKELDG
jgi:hypothetical protein